MIRYGGIYARHRDIDKKPGRAISREKHHVYRSFNQWRTAILSAFGYDPLKCECGTIMPHQVMSFRSQSGSEYYCDGLSVIESLRSKNANVYNEFTAKFNKGTGTW